MNVDVVEVSSVSRQTRQLAETAAAAFVIGAEDIRRSDAIEFALVGRNLLDARRQEFVAEFLSMTPAQTERAVYGRLTLRF